MKKVFETRIKIVTLSPGQSKVRRFLSRCKAALSFRPLYDQAHPDHQKLMLSFLGVHQFYYNPVLSLVLDIIYHCVGRRIVILPPRPGRYDYLEKVFGQGPKGPMLRSVLLIRIEGDEACLKLYFYDRDKFRSELWR